MSRVSRPRFPDVVTHQGRRTLDSWTDVSCCRVSTRTSSVISKTTQCHSTSGDLVVRIHGVSTISSKVVIDLTKEEESIWCPVLSSIAYLVLCYVSRQDLHTWSMSK